MECKVKVDELQFIFSKLSNVVSPNEDDVSSLVLMEARNGVVKFRVSSSRTHIVMTANEDQIEIVNTGKILFRFSDLKGYVSKFMPLVDNYGTEWFHFIYDEEKGLVKTKTVFKDSKPSYRRLKFPVFEVDTLPPVKDFDDPLLIVNSSILKKGINKVLHCINPNEVRDAITGVNVTIDTNRIVFTGTNGVKLAEFALDIQADIERKSYIFSYTFASILRSVLDDDAQVFIKIEADRVYVKFNNVYMIGSLLINSSYPDYKKMFELEEKVNIPRIPFYDAVYSVMDVLDAEDNNRLSLKISDNKVFLKNDKVESEQEFDQSFESELDIDVNGSLLESLLKDFMDESIDINFTSGNNYIVISSPDNANHTVLLTTVKRR